MPFIKNNNPNCADLSAHKIALNLTNLQEVSCDLRAYF